MEKIAIGAHLPKNLLDLDNTVEKNISILADAKNTTPDKLTACVLKRDRHNKIIDSLKKMNTKIKYITDGDVSGAIYVVDKKSPVDIYLGIGGGPEGVLAAAALSCLGGQIQTRLVLDKDQIKRVETLGIKNYEKKFNIDEIIKGDVIFCATAITDGELMSGVKEDNIEYQTSTFALHKNSKINKIIKNNHKK
jgi:fructose-1,6-bisphosphatase II / sedoheptulose-1,7-bisphosphatase